MPSPLSDVVAVYFDVDGTLFDKNTEFYPSKGSVQDHHEYLRNVAFKEACMGIEDEERALDEIIERYQTDVAKGAVKEQAYSFSKSLKAGYNFLREQHGSNGKVFSGEFGLSSTFLAKLIESIDFESVIPPDGKLRSMIETLSETYDVGIMTSEVYPTVEMVLDALKIPLEYFTIPGYESYSSLRDDEGTPYPILCSNNIQQKKPSREGFDKICEVTAAQPHQVLYVGDTLEKDVSPPLSLGMQAAHVVWPGDGIKEKSITPAINGCDEEKPYYEVGLYDLARLLEVAGDA